MIEILGVGLPRPRGGWYVRRGCARLDGSTVTAIVSRDADERLALADALTARVVALEGRVWVRRVPVMPATVGRVRRLVADVDVREPLAPRRSVVRHVLAARARGLTRFFRLPGVAERAAATRLLAHLGLERCKDEAAGQLTLALRTRVHVARALVRAPVYAVMREIDAGLSAAEAEALIHLLAQIARTERTGIVFTTGALDRARAVADRVLVLAGGALVVEVPGTDASGPAAVRRLTVVAAD